MNKTRVLVADDHPFFREGLVHWLNQQAATVCCGQTASIAETRLILKNTTADVILLDLQLPDGAGLDLIQELSGASPQVRVIALSQRDEDNYAHRVLRAGGRSEATDIVLAALRAVMNGEAYVSRSVSARLLHNLFPDPAALAPSLALLSDRELQVFQPLGSGCGTREIAAQLKISPKTVETYREPLKEKLKVPDSPSLVRAATLWMEKGRIDATKEAKPLITRTTGIKPGEEAWGGD